jgi:hypothetical protein
MGCLGDSNPASPNNPGDTGNDFTNEEDFASLDLTSETGGYSSGAESPYFQDESVRAMETELVDAGEREVDLVEENVSYDGYWLRIVWGLAAFDSLNTTETDWSGSVTIDRGAIKVQRIIQFEEGDSIERPREARNRVDFTSKTSVHHDGLLLRIYVRENDSPGTNMVTFASGPLTKSYSVDDLVNLSEVISVGTLGNQVSFRGDARPRRSGCPSGVLNGYWRMTPSTAKERGVFGGVWVEESGAPLGSLRGHFGLRDDGERVLFAKLIGRNGEFRGLLRGTYIPEGEGGTFEGTWFGGPDQRLGRFQGTYRIGLTSSVQVGSFDGTWTSDCDGDLGLLDNHK